MTNAWLLLVLGWVIIGLTRALKLNYHFYLVAGVIFFAALIPFTLNLIRLFRRTP